MPLEAVTRLGPYEIVSAIGAGGMREVYKARDTRLDRTVAAIKVLPEHVASDPDLNQRVPGSAPITCRRSIKQSSIEMGAADDRMCSIQTE